MSRIIDYVGQFNFYVEIEGVAAGRFREAEGIGMEIEEIEFQDGTDLWPKKRPGRKKFTNIKLKKGYINKDELFNWMMDTMKGDLSRKSGSIVMQDDSANDAMRYNFYDAWPRSWSGMRFDSKSSEVLVEEIELVVERVEMG